MTWSRAYCPTWLGLTISTACVRWAKTESVAMGIQGERLEARRSVLSALGSSSSHIRFQSRSTAPANQSQPCCLALMPDVCFSGHGKRMDHRAMHMSGFQYIKSAFFFALLLHCQSPPNCCLPPFRSAHHADAEPPGRPPDSSALGASTAILLHPIASAACLQLYLSEPKSPTTRPRSSGITSSAPHSSNLAQQPNSVAGMHVH